MLDFDKGGAPRRLTFGEERVSAPRFSPDGNFVIFAYQDITNPDGIVRAAEITPKPAVRHSDAPMCMQCGVQMNRAGSCHACPSCGSTSGCS